MYIFVYIQSLRLILQHDVYLLFVRLLFDYTKFMQLTVNMHQQWTRDEHSHADLRLVIKLNGRQSIRTFHFFDCVRVCCIEICAYNRKLSIPVITFKLLVFFKL